MVLQISAIASPRRDFLKVAMFQRPKKNAFMNNPEEAKSILEFFFWIAVFHSQLKLGLRQNLRKNRRTRT
jgi:hypothetical protein